MIAHTYFYTPVECHNGHRAKYYWSVSGISYVENEGVIASEDCKCSKFELGNGWRHTGKPVEISQREFINASILTRN